MIIRAATRPAAAAASASSATIATGTPRCGSDARRAAGVTPGEGAGLAGATGGRLARWGAAAPVAGRVKDTVGGPSAFRN